MTEPKNEVQCPGCQGTFSNKGLAGHAPRCPQWKDTIGVPVSQFNWDRYFKRGLYAEGKLECVDYVRCQECPDGACGDRGLRLLDHVKKIHGMTKETYLERHPGASLNVLSTLEKRKATVSARYDGVTNVFQIPEVKVHIKDTQTKLYGGMGVGSPVLRAKIEVTNETRYESPNPFGSLKIQEKIRATNLRVYEYENPNQSPKVIAKRIATNRRLYKVDHYFQTQDFKWSFKAASQARFKTGHPMQSVEGKRLCFAGVRAKHGVDSVFQDPEIQKRAYDTNLANHGGKHSQQCPDVLEKAKATWRMKYNTDNPSKVEAIKQKIKDVWEGKYGVPFPPQSLWTNQTHSCPNGLEKRVGKMCPVCVLFTGDKVYNVRLPGTSRDKYPDFVVLTPDQMEAYQNGASLRSLQISAVIETFGDHWHGPEITKKSRNEHYNEVMDFYAKCGVRCLILWESDVDKRPTEVTSWIQEFLQGVVDGLGSTSESVLNLFQ